MHVVTLLIWQGTGIFFFGGGGQFLICLIFKEKKLHLTYTFFMSVNVTII